MENQRPIFNFLSSFIVKSTMRRPTKARFRTACTSVAAVLLFSSAVQISAAQTAHFSGGQTGVGGGFSYPVGATITGGGALYLADEQTGKILELPSVNGTIPNSGTIRTINTTGSGIVKPWGLAKDGLGNLFVSDWTTGSVYEILAVNGTIPNVPTIKMLASGFAGPYGLALDRNGNLYLSDYFHHKVKEIVAVNKVIPDSPTIRILGSGFVGPKGVAVDGNGNVYVADYTAGEVDEMVAVSGSIPDSPTIRVLGSGWVKPDGVAVDINGNLYVSDLGTNKVYMVLATGGSISNSPSISTIGYKTENPFSVTVDPSGIVYVGGEFASIPKLNPSGWNFGNVRVGNFSPAVILTFTFDQAAILASTSFQTTGTSEQDFTDARSGTCTANTSYQAGDVCTVNVQFGPKSAGAKTGSVALKDSGGNVLASGPLQGTGVAAP